MPSPLAPWHANWDTVTLAYVNMPMPTQPVLSDRQIGWLSAVLAGLALWLTLRLDLLPALFAGLLIYELIRIGTPFLARWLTRNRNWAQWVLVSLLAIVVIGLLIGLVFGAISLLHNQLGNPQEVWRKQFVPLFDKARGQMPAWIVDHMPASVEGVRKDVMRWIGKHAGTLGHAGKQAVVVFVQILIGLVLGAIIALSQLRSRDRSGPLAVALRKRAAHLAHAFHDIVFAQVKIAAINTLLTGLFLLGALPIFGVHLPLAKTLVLLTFVIGMLPVVGNLITNVLIVIAALSVSLGVGIVALVFLIAIHKLEYFLNARIVGGQIRAAAWELLIAMLVMEAAFGLAGVIAAPIFYAYIKRELEANGLV